MEIMTTLENHYRDLCDIEFTIERGKLWMLQTRVGKRTAAAAFTVACQLVDEGLIGMDEALDRVSGAQLANLMFPRFDRDATKELLTTGMNASPGAAGGAAVFDSATAVRRAKAGEKVILVRRETTPDDLDGMIAAQGVLTSRGGRTSHAAVVARGMGKTAVCGAEELEVDVRAKKITLPDGREVVEGDVLSIDGTNGEVYLGEVPVVASPVMAYFEGSTGLAENDDLVAAVDRIMRHADSLRRLRVRVNADTGEDCATARTFGAEGVGLCRTEHMFLGERRELVETLVLAETRDQREEALAALLPHADRGLHRDLPGDGGPAGDHPAARPAAARVPARPHRAVGRGRPRPRARPAHHREGGAARVGAQAPRAEPHARAARRAARDRGARAVRHAGPRDHPGRGRARRRGRRGAARDHGAAGRDRAGAAGRRRRDRGGGGRAGVPRERGAGPPPGRAR